MRGVMEGDLSFLDAIGPEEADKTVLLVLPAKFEDGKSILDWAFKQFLVKDFRSIVVSVIHTPRQATVLRKESLDKFRQLEKEQLILVLNKYLLECRQNCKLEAYKILMEANNIDGGLARIIRKVKIKHIVIGTMKYSRKTAMDISNKLIEQTDPLCKIWFLSNGKITLTRNVRNTDAPSTSSSTGDDQIARFQEDLDADIDIHQKFKKKILEESKARLNAEKEMLSVSQKAIFLMKKISSDLHAQDTQWKSEMDSYVSKAKQEREILRNENLELKSGNRETDYKAMKESRDDAIKENRDLIERMQRLERNCKKLEKEKEDALNALISNKMASNCVFSLEELNQTTNYFNDSKKIGKGRLGHVYKGHLCNMAVAIKKLDPQNLQDRSEFEQELEIMTKMRHPNIVTLIGACPVALALVYEHFPNGTLEDRINRTGKTPALRWQARTRIIGEICRALIFLHSNKPKPVVHGDLKPQNVLLDSHLVCKIRLFSKFGASRLVNRFQEMNPYRDPELRSTGQPKPHSDVYSLGIIILHLLTGKRSFNIAKRVWLATETEIGLMIDQTAGNWPGIQAIKLARIGSRCASPSRNRPELSEVWKLIEPLVRVANSSVAPCVCTVRVDDHVPSYFLCPITQEIMKDPQIAADGYTYESTAIRTWMLTGPGRSPITNLPLQSRSLVPNHALRSSILEWLQHHPQQ